MRYNKEGKLNSVGLDCYAVHGGNMTAYSPELNQVLSYTDKIPWNSQLKELMIQNPPRWR
jgi:hypothetical protein